MNRTSRLVYYPCELCHSEQFVPTYPSTLKDSLADPASFFTSSRLSSGHPPIVRCLKCGLVQTNPRDDPDTLVQIYSVMSDNDYEQEEHSRRRTSRNQLKWAERFHPQRGRLLDAGCATGIFLEQALSNGWDASGLEPSSWSLERARQRCPTADLYQATLEAASFPPASFDVITLWDVLEHVPHPIEILNTVHTWLSTSGWLFLNLPNINSLSARLLGPYWMLLLREHLWYFSPQTLNQALNDTGFKIIAVEPNRVHFSLTGIIKRLAQYLPSRYKINRLFARPTFLSRLQLAFSMGEMRVAAQKTAQKTAQKIHL